MQEIRQRRNTSMKRQEGISTSNTSKSITSNSKFNTDLTHNVWMNRKNLNLLKQDLYFIGMSHLMLLIFFLNHWK
jgi:hypothetical protein